MKIPLSTKKATAQTVASDNIIPYVIFCFHERISICRFHEFSHSHASLLVEMGFTPLAIAERLGHEKIETTLNTYSHLYPNKQGELADRLEMENNREDEE